MRDSCSNYIGHNGGPTRPERHAQAWNDARYQKAAERTGRVHCSDDTIENSMAIMGLPCADVWPWPAACGAVPVQPELPGPLSGLPPDPNPFSERPGVGYGN